MGIAMMTVADHFADDTLLADYLANQLRFGRLAIFLGAGVSRHFGLPDWNSLIDALVAAKSVAIDPALRLTSLAIAERVRHQCTDENEFLELVHQELYRSAKTDFVTLRTHATLAAIASLVMASKRGTASEVVTFNFDDMLEIYLRYHGFVVTSVADERHWTDNADVRIYHPHGVLPAAPAGKRSRLVFDQLSYSETVGRDAAPWNQLLRTIMRRNTCLFIGLSGADANMDSLLAATRDVHASLSDHVKYWGVSFTTTDDEIDSKTWAQRGIYLKQVSDWNLALPQFLFHVCQRAAEQS